MLPPRGKPVNAPVPIHPLAGQRFAVLRRTEPPRVSPAGRHLAAGSAVGHGCGPAPRCGGCCGDAPGRCYSVEWVLFALVANRVLAPTKDQHATRPGGALYHPPDRGVRICARRTASLFWLV